MDLGMGVPAKRLAAAGAEATAGATPAKTAKKGGGKQVKKEEGDKLEAALQALGRLSLATARDVAELRGALTVNMLFNREDGEGKVVFEACKDAAQAYNTMTQSMSPTQKAAAGSPHIYIWHALLTVLAEKGKSSTDQATLNQVKVITLYMEGVAQAAKQAASSGGSEPAAQVVQEHSRGLVAAQVKIVKVVRCFDVAKGRMEFYVTEEAVKVVNAIKWLVLKHMKGELRQGKAPKSDAERKVAELVMPKN
eukprot:TRINITY_DN46269_c0_g3_i1.p2 TRINITY_DN46269_c0_g3~~TRINITY_DN46269_c0_g3_i1.p2  ORF type:complete len:251 (-),score=95.39 TRINITY_DN46269_c0_g3_i1:160-912(-)